MVVSLADLDKEPSMELLIVLCVSWVISVTWLVYEIESAQLQQDY